MKPSSIIRALDAMDTLERGKPYSLRPDDPKRKLADELARLARELGIRPVIIGGLAVNHHGYLRVTRDVDLLLSERDAVALFRRLKAEPGWRRYHEGFKNASLDVAVDVCVAGRKTSPSWEETFPEPSVIETSRVDPLPVPVLEELLALKAMSGRLKDDGDIGELLKLRPKRLDALHKAARARLRTEAARRHLDDVVARAREELARRKRS